MTSFICPCCGENYHVDVDVQVGRKVFCGKCQMKHVYYNNTLVPFAVELSPRGDDRRIACPFCQHHFVVDKTNYGEYCCIQCGTHFYVAQKPEVFAPGVVPGASAPIPPKPIIPAVIPEADLSKLSPESFAGCTTEPLTDIPLELPPEENTESPVPDLIEEAERRREDTPDDGSDSDTITVRLVYHAPKEVSDTLPEELLLAAPAAKEKSGLTGTLRKLAGKFRGK